MKKGIHFIIIDRFDVIKGLSHIKKKIYNKCLELNLPCIELEKDDEWLNCNSRGFEMEDSNIKRKEKLLEYIADSENNASGYMLKDPDVVINKVNSKKGDGGIAKFILICPKGHEYTTDMDNFINNHRRCMTCGGKQKKDISDIKDIIEDLYDYITVPINQEYNGVDEPINIYCETCKVSFKMSLSNIKRNKKRYSKAHKKCEVKVVKPIK